MQDAYFTPGKGRETIGSVTTHLLDLTMNKRGLLADSYVGHECDSKCGPRGCYTIITPKEGNLFFKWLHGRQRTVLVEKNAVVS